MANLSHSEFGPQHLETPNTPIAPAKPLSLRSRIGRFFDRISNVEPMPTPEQQADPGFLASKLDKLATTDEVPFSEPDIAYNVFNFMHRDASKPDAEAVLTRMRRGLSLLIADGAIERGTFTRGNKTSIDGYRIVNREALRSRAQLYEARQNAAQR